MKKILIISLLCLWGFAASAQYKGQWRAIHAYELTGNNTYFGMNFTGEYFPFHYVSIAPALTFFIPSQGNARAFDLNARYYFTEKNKQWYGLMGYGHFTRKEETTPVQTIRYNSLNVGMGGMLKLRDELGINPEIRRQFGSNDWVFKLGVVYFIN